MYGNSNGSVRTIGKSIIVGVSLITIALLTMTFMMLVSFEDSSDTLEPQVFGMDVSDDGDTVPLYYHTGAGYGDSYHIQVEIGQTHQIIEPPFLNVPQDKEFLHWRLLTPNQEPGYIVYNTGDTFTITADLIPDTSEPSDRYISLVAIWGDFKDIVISFDTDGGSRVDSIVGKHGELLPSPVNPVKNGFDFLGWSPSLPSHFPIESTTYTAIWGHIFPLHYHTGTGYGEDYVCTVKAGEVYKIIEPPFLNTPQDKVFDHWRLLTPNQEPGYIEYNTGDTFTITDDLIPDAPAPDRYISLVAIWGDFKDIVISFDTDGGSEIDDIVGKYGDVLHPPANPTKLGAAFVGWSPNLPAYFPMENKTYKAIWTTDVRTITFDTDGGSYVPPASYIPDQKITPPEPPTKDGYTFRGWSPELPEFMPFEDIVVKAIWEIGYQITFCNWDGTVLQSSMCLKGELPEYLGETPVRETDAQYTYTFAGWEPTVVTVSESATYIAVYDLQINSYEVTFTDEFGNVLQSDVLEYGAMPTFRGDLPTKEREEHYSYMFIGWEPAVEVVTGPVTYVASFEKIPDKYTVTWVDDDGSILYIDTEAPYGEKPVYRGEVPVKPSDEKYHHVFSTWDPQVAIVTGDATYKALYREVPVEYRVCYKDYDGTLLYTYADTYGSYPAYFGESLKGKIIQIDGCPHVYAGWTPELSNISGDVTYTAKYVPVEYEITFKNWNGEILDKQSVKHGVEPVYAGASPTKPDDGNKKFVFAGWDPEIGPATSDATYTATFIEGDRELTIKFVNYDGQVLKTYTVAYGEVPIYDGSTPTKEATVQYSYEFKGWTPKVVAATEDKTYTAEYSEIVNTYPITFKNWDGNEILSVMIPYGEMVTYNGEVPTRPAEVAVAYTFAGWSPELAIVTGPAVYTATYTESPVKYTVTFMNHDGSILQSRELVYGSTPVYNGATPTKAASAQYTYTFKGWDPAIGPVTGDVIYTATYNESLRLYLVTFKDYDGRELQSEAVEYGKMPTFNGDLPVKEPTEQYRYIFKTWSPAVVTVTKDDVYTATYMEELREYSATFLVGDDTFRKYVLEYGSNILAPADAPFIPDVNGYKFTFIGWDGFEDGLTIQKDVEFVAMFVPEPRFYPDVVDKEVVFDIDEDMMILGEAIIDETHSKFETGEIDRFLIKLDDGSIAFDKDAFFIFRSERVSLSIDRLGYFEVPDAIAQVAQGCPVYDISVGNHHNFGKGLLTLSIDFDMTDDIVKDSIRVLHFKDNGDFETVDFVYENGKITFDTSTLSYFAIVYDAPTDSEPRDDYTLLIVIAVVCAIGVVAFAFRRRF